MNVSLSDLTKRISTTPAGRALIETVANAPDPQAAVAAAMSKEPSLITADVIDLQRALVSDAKGAVDAARATADASTAARLQSGGSLGGLLGLASGWSSETSPRYPVLEDFSPEKLRE